MSGSLESSPGIRLKIRDDGVSPPVVPAETSGSHFEMLPTLPEGCALRQAQFFGTELLAILCKHTTKQATEGRAVPREEDSEGRMERQDRVG